MGYTSLASLEGAVMDLGANTLRLVPLEYRENNVGVANDVLEVPFDAHPIYLKTEKTSFSRNRSRSFQKVKAPGYPPWVQDHLLGSQHW